MLRSKFYRTFLIVLLTLVVGLPACSENSSKRTIYFWQSEFNLDSADYASFHQLRIERVYIRYFDIDWSYPTRQAIPVAPVQFKEIPSSGFDWIPCVFITQRTFINLPPDELNNLANKTLLLIDKLSLEAGIQPKEIQMDCDWNESTRPSYFLFLDTIRSALKEKDIQLSATIRLHQVKYPEITGIPPVDRGMLMAYNLDPVGKLETQNAIFSHQTLRQYLHPETSYPLPLDLVLPVFSWGVLFRDGELIQLIPSLDEEQPELRKQAKQLENFLWQLQQDGFIAGIPVYKYDLIRLESVIPDTLVHAAKTINNTNLTFRTIGVYHYHQNLFNHFSIDELETVYQAFP